MVLMLLVGLCVSVVDVAVVLSDMLALFVVLLLLLLLWLLLLLLLLLLVDVLMLLLLLVVLLLLSLSLLVLLLLFVVVVVFCCFVVVVVAAVVVTASDVVTYVGCWGGCGCGIVDSVCVTGIAADAGVIIMNSYVIVGVLGCYVAVIVVIVVHRVGAVVCGVGDRI